MSKAQKLVALGLALIIVAGALLSLAAPVPLSIAVGFCGLILLLGAPILADL